VPISLSAASALLLLVGGCITTGPLEYVRNGFKVGPNYSPAPAAVAQNWIEAGDAKVQDRRLQDWWRVFQDQTLDSLIATALEQNVSLRIAGARVLEARAQQLVAVGNLFPQVQQATGQYQRTNLSRTTANNPAIFDILFAASPNSSLIFSTLPASLLPTNFYSTWSEGFNLSWELDFWGRFRRGVESASASFDASVENYHDALVTLLADLATNYVQYRVAQQRIAIARENVRIQEGILALTQEKLKAGTADRLDVAQARTVLEQTRSTIPALQITLGQANDALCTLLGFPPRDLEPELGSRAELGGEPVPTMPTWVAAGIPADLLRQRPDVRSAERQVAAQSAQIGVAEAELYPTIFINGNLGWESQDLAHLFESRSFMGNITPNFKWNILNYGRILNNVRLQQARTQELIATYQGKVLTAGREVQNALRGFLRSQEQAADLVRSVAAAKEATEVGMHQQRVGAIDYNRVFVLETTRVQQQDQLAVAQGNVALSLINVYRALGGGWEVRYSGSVQSPSSDAPANGHVTNEPPE
jgi:NodT family efflux transporter outer membrane factor (OMF) lipoprotein